MATKRGTFTFQLEEDKDRKFLDDTARDLGIEKASVLMRNIVRKMKGMSTEELRALILNTPQENG